MAQHERNRRLNGQFAPNLLGRNAPTPASLLPASMKLPTTPYSEEISSFYWSNYQGVKRRSAVAEAHPELFPAGGSWYEDASDENSLVYLYLSQGNTQPLRWVKVDRLDNTAFTVLEMSSDGVARELFSGSSATSDAE